MIIYYPTWLRQGKPNSVTSVFSVDIQPNGTRLATCGQDCTIKIWDLRIISLHAQQHNLEQKQQQQQQQQKQEQPSGALLTTLTSHSAAVNVIRWSPNGKFLASAGDDAVILIHHQIKSSGNTPISTFGNTSRKSTDENWIHTRPLRSHISDITDLAWSPDSQRLISASVDNSIIVWNVKNESYLMRLEGHKGFVKGVAWDPVGRFIASQADDRSVRIWRTSDWKTDVV